MDSTLHTLSGWMVKERVKKKCYLVSEKKVIKKPQATAPHTASRDYWAETLKQLQLLLGTGFCRVILFVSMTMKAEATD